MQIFTLFMPQVQWNILKTFQHISCTNWGTGEGKMPARAMIQERLLNIIQFY